MYTKKDERRSYYFLFFLVIALTLISTGLKVRFWVANGVYQTVRDQNTVVAYIRDNQDPIKTFTIFATGHSQDLVAYFPKYIPWEGQNVSMFRIYAETKTKKSPYITWVTPRFISLSNHTGEFGLVADDSGRTENMGYVRNSPVRRYTISVDNNTPHYRTLSLGILPEIGRNINFWYLEIFFSREKFFNLAILY